MTAKEEVIAMLGRLPDDVTLYRILYHVHVLHNIHVGMEQAERGEVFTTEEVFEELLRDDEEDQAGLVDPSKARPQRNKGVHQSRRSKNGQKVRQAAKRVRKKT